MDGAPSNIWITEVEKSLGLPENYTAAFVDDSLLCPTKRQLLIGKIVDVNTIKMKLSYLLFWFKSKCNSQ